MIPSSQSNGNFAKSSDVAISVATDYNYGYTLSITAADSTDLKDGSNVIPSINGIVTENNFSQSPNYNNQWGYSPSKYYDSSNDTIITNTNRDFIPSPSTSGSIIDKTTTPNDTANAYAISIGAKANYNLAPGSYDNTFVLTAIANSVPYVINYHANTTDTVTDLPAAQVGSTYETSINLSSTKPSRGAYGFYGWCTEPTTTVDGCVSLGGTTYRAKAAYPLDPASSNTIDLYAIWGTYSELDIGANVNIKMKSLVPNASVTDYATPDSSIKAIRMASALPDGFTPTQDNTISIIGSTHEPTYIWFDNTNNAGIIYVYTAADKVRMNAETNGYSRMFCEFNALTDISGLADWDTQITTSFRSLFWDVTSITSLHGLESWDTSNVTNMSGIFYGNTSLTDISALANWDTSNVTNMQRVFYKNYSLASLRGLENWDVSNVTNMSNAFVDCISLTNLDALANWDTSSNTTLYFTFGINDNAISDSNIPQLSDISGLANWDTSSVTNMYGLFPNQLSLTALHGLENWDTSSVTDMRFTFYHDTALTDISALANWDTSNVTDMLNTFRGNTALTSLHGLEDWDTSNVTNMQSTFQNNTLLADISALAKWDTSSVTNMAYTFLDDTSLISLHGLESWDTSNVTNMSGIFGLNPGFFKSTDSLAPLANWKVGNVTNMSYMFLNVNVPSFEPLANWDVSKVSDFSWFNGFYGSTASPTGITSLHGLESWNVSSATNMQSMFDGLTSLTDASALNNWNIANVTNFTNMFNRVSTHPTFTNRAGTWDSNGTFTPSS